MLILAGSLVNFLDRAPRVPVYHRERERADFLHRCMRRFSLFGLDRGGGARGGGEED
jgi:hypothetical protein